MLSRIVTHPLYILIVVFVGMPLIGVHFARGQYLFSFILWIMQLPWFFEVVISKIDD